MFHIALTPNENPANALSATSETLMGAIADLLNSISLVSGSEEWFVSRVLEATKEAVDNLENDQPAKGAWSDFSSPDDAFSIDIFCSDDARYVRLDGDDLLVPHGAVGLVVEEHTTRWIYDESEISQWNNVRLPQKRIEPNESVEALKYHVSGAIARGEAVAIVEQPVKPTIESHNEPLRQAMFARGCKWVVNGAYESFQLNGKYEPYPVGYIRVHRNGSSHPRLPHQFSVQTINGWLQLSFATIEEGTNWALESASNALNPAPTITEVIRDIKHGDCTLSAIFSDGSERKLFNFFIDELSFSDFELIGKTETEAQALHSQKDSAYLRS